MKRGEGHRYHSRPAPVCAVSALQGHAGWAAAAGTAGQDFLPCHTCPEFTPVPAWNWARQVCSGLPLTHPFTLRLLRRVPDIQAAPHVILIPSTPEDVPHADTPDRPAAELAQSTDSAAAQRRGGYSTPFPGYPRQARRSSASAACPALSWTSCCTAWTASTGECTGRTHPWQG